MDELGFAYVYGPAYSPDFNGIETVFSIAKAFVKKQRLACIMQGREIKLRQMIVEAFQRINVLKIVNCINHSEKLLFNA